MRTPSRRLAPLLACAVAILALRATAADWPQWRGPTRDGAVPATDAAAPWPDKLDDKHLALDWRVDLGLSFSAPVVAGDTVFVTESADKSEIVRALDRATGKQRWEAKWPADMTVPFFAAKMGSWIRATPAYDAESKCLFVAGMRDVVVCLNAADGTERWRADLMARNKAPLPAFGFVSSPLVAGDAVFVQAGGAVLRLDKATGRTVWATLADGGGMNGSAFASPRLATLCGAETLLVQTRAALAGVDPATGKSRFSADVPAFRGMNIVDPTVAAPGTFDPPAPAQLFTTSYGGGSFLVTVSRAPDGTWTVAEKWKNVPLEGYMSTPVVVAGHAYVHARDQKLHCLDLASGRQTWASAERFGEYASLLTRADRVLALDQRGELLLLRADPAKYDLLDRRKIADQDTWAHLALAGDELYVREFRALARWHWRAAPAVP